MIFQRILYLMKTTNILIPTQKEVPNDAIIASHQLMIRAGLISKSAAGLYSYLPLGLRILQKIEAIVRSEMNKSGAQEVLMPMVQSAKLWQKSGRWDEYGVELLRFCDRHDQEFCLGPTHEEVITDIAAQYLRSYKQLPTNFYQIQTKFRDEIRPRFGVMRAREFIMKDAYSFHLDADSLQQTFDLMHQTYCRIFTRLGLDFRPVIADSGNIGGDASIEFHVLADAGEDAVCFSDKSDYAANIERAETLPQSPPQPPKQDLKTINTPDQKTIDEVAQFLKTDPKKIIKTLIVEADDGGLVALALRGDHELNEVKVGKISKLASPFKMANDAKIKQIIGCKVGSIGVVDLPVPLFVDYAAATLSDFVCGKNADGKHLIGVNWQRDVGDINTADLRNVEAGDPSPDGEGHLVIKRGIEVGHIFQLGQKYSQKLGANIIAQDGRATAMEMGCYGIGVSRILAASIEQNHDQHGIIFPLSIAPFEVIIVPINYHKSTRVKDLSEQLYQQFSAAGVEVLLDDKKQRAGIAFAEAELLGIPYRVVISDRLADKESVEIKARIDDKTTEIAFSEALKFIQSKLS